MGTRSEIVAGSGSNKPSAWMLGGGFALQQWTRKARGRQGGRRGARGKWPSGLEGLPGREGREQGSRVCTGRLCGNERLELGNLGLE